MALAVCLGKFDAMHKGHFALAERAATLGEPVLVSFSGMAETLGWDDRLPITAPSDRTRVLALWGKKIGGPFGEFLREHAIPFKSVRELSPEAFVETLAAMGVGAVVTGENYRFGYKAAGDVEALKMHGAASGMQVDVVSLVPADKPSPLGLGNQVSSTRVRRALADGYIEEANALLGRQHRVVFNMSGERMAKALQFAIDSDAQDVNISLDAAENQPPSDGTYTVRVLIDPTDDEAISPSTADNLFTIKVSYGRIVINREDAPKVVYARERVVVDFHARTTPRYANNTSGGSGRL